MSLQWQTAVDCEQRPKVGDGVIGGLDFVIDPVADLNPLDDFSQLGVDPARAGLAK